MYLKPNGQNGQFILDNGGQAGTSTLLQSASSADLTLRNGAIGLIGALRTFGNLLVSSNAWLLMTNSGYTVTLSSATIQAGGGIIADAFGYAAGQVSGAGQGYSTSSNYPCSGAGHGGYGANSTGNFALGGNPYDSTTTPFSPGSGGGNYSPYSVGGAGGGAIRLIVSGNLQVDGRISANGGNGSGNGGGGGSGGGIWLAVGTLSGIGSITANGGSGVDAIGGGGGGGRVYIGYTASSFGGLISAYGGGGANWGGAGTVFLQPGGQNGQLILDNGGHSGTNTPVQSASSADLILRNGAIGSASSSVSFANLLMSTNARLVPAYGYSLPAPTVYLSFSGNATIQAGSGIFTDTAGYPAGQDLVLDELFQQQLSMQWSRSRGQRREQRRKLRRRWKHL